MKKFIKVIVGIGIVVAIGVIGFVACGNAVSNSVNDALNATEPVNKVTSSMDDSDSTTDTSEVETNEFTINDTIECGGVTYNFEKYNFGNDEISEYNVKEGYSVMTVVVSAKNDSGEDFTTGTIECYADDGKCENAYISSTIEDKFGTLDNGFINLSAGREGKYEVSFYIPDGAAEIELEMDKALFSLDDGKILIKVTE